MKNSFGVKHDKNYKCGDLSRFPNFHKSGSIKGMKAKYYGKDAKLIRQGNWIYNVSSEPVIYDNLHNC